MQSVGPARQLERGPIVQFQNTQWFPDSRHVFFVASEDDGVMRGYRQAIDGGAPERLDIEGAANTSLLTLDGSAVLGQASDTRWYLFPLAGGEPQLVAGLQAEDKIIALQRGGNAVYVREQNLVPATYIRVDLATGKRVVAFTLGPDPSPGLLGLDFAGPALDPTQGYAYGYIKTLSQIYVVKGVRW